MKIAMFTNTYIPHVGGVAESVLRLAKDCREHGHQVRVVAPEFPNMPEHEENVCRVPAIQNFNGSDFSVSLPAPVLLSKALDAFEPDVIHAHHPYLLGDTALRVSASRDLPLIFTYHTMYEDYTHYVPADSPQLKRFVIELATGYANLCDQVVAPSESIADILRERGVTTPITVIPTGVDCEHFARGNGARVRQELHLPENAFVIGHVGRLAPEKNLLFLARAVTACLRRTPRTYFLVVGDGEATDEMEQIFREAGVWHQVIFAGVQQDPELLNYYHAMDLFAFASKTETQGMVLAEAMAAGIPVVALDAPGAREIVQDQQNGCLLADEDSESFAAALMKSIALPSETYQQWQQQAFATARNFSHDVATEKMLHLYDNLWKGTHKKKSRGLEEGDWEALTRAVKQEWDIWSNRLHAGLHALTNSESAAE